MTNKERVQAAFEGRAVDCLPVFASYAALYYLDHFDELTGQPRHYFHKWLYSTRDKFIATLRQIVDAAPFDILHAPYAVAESQRKQVEFVEKDGKAFLHNTKTDAWSEINVKTKSGHASDYAADETAIVKNIRDIKEKIVVTKAEEHIRAGAVERHCDVVDAFGSEKFIITGNVVGTIYGAGEYVGQTNALMMFLEKPDLMHEICKRHTEKNIEWFRALCTAGGDAFFIDDATATNDMISVEMYEEFCLPYIKQLVDEAHSLGHKVFLVYFGGVADRLEQIGASGADGLAMEASMKRFTNDMGIAADALGDRMALFGNINPYDHLEQLSDKELESVMRKQAAEGRKARGFIMSTGSPITMDTPLSRVRKFIEIARSL